MRESTAMRIRNWRCAAKNYFFWEVPDGVGVDGVEVKCPIIFPLLSSVFLSFSSHGAASLQPRLHRPCSKVQYLLTLAEVWWLGFLAYSSEEGSHGEHPFTFGGSIQGLYYVHSTPPTSLPALQADDKWERSYGPMAHIHCLGARLDMLPYQPAPPSINRRAGGRFIRCIQGVDCLKRPVLQCFVLTPQGGECLMALGAQKNNMTTRDVTGFFS